MNPASMDLTLKDDVLASIKNYQLPRYRQIPDVGLYLNQVVKYINGYLDPFVEMDITESMISNYVKKHLVNNPQKKLYDREQIAYLLLIAIAKSVLSLDNISHLLDIQRASYDGEVAYDYFCNEFENMLQYVFGIKDNIDQIGNDSNEVKFLFRNIIITAAHKIYLDHCFNRYRSK